MGALKGKSTDLMTAGQMVLGWVRAKVDQKVGRWVGRMAGRWVA